MAIPTVIASNQTGGAIPLTRLGLTVPAASTLNLSLYAYIDEMLQDESLYNAIVAGSILLNYGDGDLTKGESLKFFDFVTHEMRMPVRALRDTNLAPLSGVGQTIDTTVVVVAEDRILLTNQTAPAENGIWVAKAGAWERPEDFALATSASGAQVMVEEGTVYAGQNWVCTDVVGSDIVGTSALTFEALSGADATLQSAYDNGNTIVTAAGRDIAFTLTNGDFTVDDGSVVFGGGTALTDFSVDTGTMSLDSTDTTNLTMTANNAGAKTLTIEATNAGAGTGNLDVNVDDAITIDSANAGFSIDGVTSSNVTVTGASQDLTLSSVGGSVAIDGSEAAVDAVSITASDSAGGIDINAGTGGITVDTTGTLSLDSVGASNWTNDSGNLTLNTTTTGEVLIDGIDGVEINSSAGAIDIGNDADTGDINIGTGAAARDITVGNKTGATSLTLESGTGNTLMDTPQVRITGDLVVDGTTTTIHSEHVDIADSFLYLNADYTTVAGMEGGLVINYLPTATNDTVAATGFVAAVGGVSNAYVNTTGAAVFTAGDIVQVSGANDQSNDGIYEVLSHVANVLTIKGVGVTAVTVPFVQNDFVTDTTVAGTITKINVSAIQTDTTGDWQVGSGSTTTGWTWYDIINSGTISLQTAYEGGNTITTAVADGDVTINGTEDFLVGGSVDVSFDTTGSISFDADVASNFTVDGANLTLSTTTTGSVLVDGIDGVEINSSAGNINVGNDADDGDINIGTGTTNGRAITIGNNTGTTGVTIDSGSEMVEIDGVTYYGTSAGSPTATSSGFQEGDKYWDTNIEMEMRYDSTRAKWLSVESMTYLFGRNGACAVGQYYRGVDGRVMGQVGAAEIGYVQSYDATVVSLGYTRSDSDAATFDIMADGVSIDSLASAAVKGYDNALDGDIDQGEVLQIMNQAGGNVTSDVMGWVRVKYRVDVP